jgi:hypothetical protein
MLNYHDWRQFFEREGLNIRTGNVLSGFMLYHKYDSDDVLHNISDDTFLRCAGFGKASFKDLRKYYPALRETVFPTPPTSQDVKTLVSELKELRARLDEIIRHNSFD